MSSPREKQLYFFITVFSFAKDSVSFAVTIALIEKYADQIIPFTWCDDFAAARNAGLERCRGEWFLYLDDDEVLEEPEALVAFLQAPSSIAYEYASLALKNYVNDDRGVDFSSYVTRYSLSVSLNNAEKSAFLSQAMCRPVQLVPEYW